MKKVLFLHSSRNFSGGEKVTLMIASSLVANKNIIPIIGCYKENIQFIEEANRIGVTVIPMNICDISASSPIKSIQAIFEVSYILIKNKISLIQVVDPAAYRYIAIPAAITRTTRIFHYHFPYSDEALSWFFNWLPKPEIMLYCCDAISNKMANCLSKLAPNASNLTIHNGIDLNKFSFSKNRNNPPQNIAIVGNLQARKGHLDFIQMASQLSDIPNLTFHIIGDDVEGENRKLGLKDKCEELGISEKVVFHGFVNDVHRVLTSMDILVCASYEEAFPLNILEAMAVGIPVVSTNVDGIPEAITHGVNGYLVQPGDSKAMGHYVRLLVEDPDTLNNTVKHAYESVTQHFSEPIFGAKFKNFYNSL